MKIFYTFLLLLFLTLLQTRFFLGSQFPITHDGENHLLRIANFRIAIREGQFPPRFAPNLLNGYGYPVFNYNYPLANILSLPFSVLKFHPELILKILFIVFVLIGIWGVFSLLRALKLSYSSSLFGVSIFGLSPFLFSTIIYRGNIGELMGISLLAWVFWAIVKLQSTTQISLRIVLIFTLFTLSHNLTVVFSLPLLFCFAVLQFRKNREIWKVFFYHALISILAVLWFWLPAIWEQKEVVVSNASLVSAFVTHLLAPSQLISSPLQFGYSYPGLIDSLSFQLGFSQILLLFITTFFVIKMLLLKKKDIKDKSVISFFYVTTVVCLLGTLYWFSAVWNVFSWFKILQFPWRLELFTTLTIAVLAGYIWSHLGIKVKKLFLLLLIIQTSILFRLKPLGFFHHEKNYYDFSGQSSSTQNENLPKTFTFIDIGNWLPQPQIVTGNGQIDVEKWTGSERFYTVITDENVTIIEPTMFFLGWTTTAQSEQGISIEVQNIFTEETRGRIAYNLAPGNYQVHTRFTQRTPARIVGNSAFGLSLIVFIFLMYRKKITW